MSDNRLNFGDYMSDLNITDSREVEIADGTANQRQCYVIYEADDGGVVEIWDTMLGAIVRTAELNNNHGDGTYEFEPAPYYSNLFS